MLPLERWIPITQSNERYAISDYGRVKKLTGIMGPACKDGIVKEQLNYQGKARVSVYFDGKHRKWTVSRLVAEHFISPLKLDQHVHHKDRNKTNNIYTNLEILSRKDHFEEHLETFKAAIMKHQAGETNSFAKMTYAKVKHLRFLKSKGFSQRDLAWLFGIAESTTSQIIAGKTWISIDGGQ